MTYLILPDIHLCHNKAEKIIKHEACDKIICLGDEMDDYNDDPTQVKETAEWLTWSVNQKNRLHVVGNHLVSYINKNFACSGWEQWKQIIVDQYCNWDKTWSKMRWFANLDNQYILSHAGLTAQALPVLPEYNISTISNWLENQSEQATVNIRSNKNHWFYKAGFSRGGNMPYGGLVWCDFSEFKPINNVSQVMGHNPRDSKNRNENSFIIRGENSNNIDLDTIGHLNRYAVYDSNSKTLLVKYYENL